MLEETNDNLPLVDGNNAVNTQGNEVSAIEIEGVEPQNDIEITENVVSVEQVDVVIDPVLEAEVRSESIENEVVVAAHEIAETPLLDYGALSMDDLVAALEAMVGVEDVMPVKDQIEHIKSSYLAKYQHFIEEKKRPADKSAGRCQVRW